MNAQDVELTKRAEDYIIYNRYPFLGNDLKWKWHNANDFKAFDSNQTKEKILYYKEYILKNCEMAFDKNYITELRADFDISQIRHNPYSVGLWLYAVIVENYLFIVFPWEYDNKYKILKTEIKNKVFNLKALDFREIYKHMKDSQYPLVQKELKEYLKYLTRTMPIYDASSKKARELFGGLMD